MKSRPAIVLILFVVISMTTACKKSTVFNAGRMQITKVKAGDIELRLNETVPDIRIDSSFTIAFNVMVDLASARNNIILKKENNTAVVCDITLSRDLLVAKVSPLKPLSNSTHYTLQVLSGI
jgi:hypothetical protein